MYIEKAKSEEFEEYYAIKCEEHNLYWTASNLNQPPRENIKKFYEKCIGMTDEPIRKEIYLIKDDDGAVAGYVYLDIQGDVLDIPVAVKKEYTGRGFVAKAVMEGMKKAKQMGFKRAVGKIREDNIASMKLYAKCGWKLTEEYDNFFSEELNKNIKMYKVYADL